MDEHDKTSDFYRLFEAVRIPFVLTDINLRLAYANRFAREALPLKLEKGERLDVETFLQREDSVAFEHMISECQIHGESVHTLKQRGADKYFKVRAYNLKNPAGEIGFHFEDVSHARILEDQLYEHLVDLYSQLETQEREIADLKAILLRVQGD